MRVERAEGAEGAEGRISRTDGGTDVARRRRRREPTRRPADPDEPSDIHPEGGPRAPRPRSPPGARSVPGSQAKVLGVGWGTTLNGWEGPGSGKSGAGPGSHYYKNITG
ncbi:hypothetical protein MPTK1_3g04290 [Marchantia polymorpha subsp. ruderalis]|uniref:Uncharacterized protein n=2 Tax=Marchantia polymorpha TaxID=3197 RepID=A0AAF6AXC0_MARPO|nr:hypothetical protein MARPO_0022s0102 [Marchantia polymorpha]BBN04404.1 hypothetical protein Mp_3g04290 [Marchantia polymorpha subsp. ruderalis]|eukprot:PTQ44000.1 hypothetical protein MARPO_0022s0102 [Marchantia polymorpha]